VVVNELISHVNFTATDLVLEIGPGKGVITDFLIKKSKKVLAIEADPRLFSDLRKKYASATNLLLVHADFVKYPLPKKPFIVVSNIPFNITANIIRKVTDEKSELNTAYFILQKEAAIKFLGAPYAHSPLLSHILNINFEINHLMDIARLNYVPKPRFDTTFISIRKRKKPVFEGQGAEQFRDFLVYIFERRKPNIKGALKSVLSNLQTKIILDNLNISAGTETKKIIFTDWVKIFETFAQHAPDKSKKMIGGSYKRLLAEQSQLKKVHRTRNDS